MIKLGGGGSGGGGARETLIKWGRLNEGKRKERKKTGRKTGGKERVGRGRGVLVFEYLSPKVVIELFNGVQRLTQLVREVYLFTLHYLSTSLDHVLHFRLQSAHRLVVFLGQEEHKSDIL